MTNVVKGYADTDTDVGQVHYRACGDRRGASLPLVLLHQTASSSVMFQRLMPLLSADAWTFAPDTPGFGGTDALPDRASVARYAEVVVAAMDSVGIERCNLFGHHSGASVAVQIAHDHPDRIERLALSGPPFLSRAQIEKLIPTVCPIAIEPDGAHLMAVWNRIRAKDPTAPLELSHREAVLNLHAGVRYPEAYAAVFDHDLPRQLAAVECPTLVMAGAQDTIAASLEHAYRVLGNGTMTMFPSGGTYICDREPGQVAGALRTFFYNGGN
jgi:pimeloyl-ACP methyl ester carboxylesterase